ncbi:MAG: site-specific integrase [Thermotogae bacterium]|nr:site-specific integrase [Thermotogota bacterium]
MVKMFRRYNGVLYLEYELNGKKVQKSTKLQDTPQNRSLIKKEVIPSLQRKLLLGQVGREKPKDFAYYSELYLKEKTHLKTYKQFVRMTNIINEAFGKVNVAEIKRPHVKKWAYERLEINSPKTVKEYLTVIRGILDIAIEHEHIQNNVARHIKLPQHKRATIEPFTSYEVTQILTKANSWLRLYLAIGFYSGLRTGEILGLMRSDIDLEARVIHVRRNVTKGRISTPKTKKSFREVPILDDLLPYLRALPKSMWLFPSSDGHPIKSFGRYRRQQWRDLLNECGITYRKIYATRHTFIVSMLKHSDLSILEIAQIAGHSSTQMIVQHYGRFIKGEHLKIDRSIKLFTDKSADSCA